MAVLVLKFSGPLQSWGTGLKLKDHETDSMPSKSGTIGMIAAAMGRRRNEDISDLASLRFGVREDEPGEILHDYHAAHTYKGEKITATDVGRRDYIQDACFVVGLEGDRDMLERCEHALHHPIFQLYLGRRSCVPDVGMVKGIFEGDLEGVLSAFPKQTGGNEWDETDQRERRKKSEGNALRLCVETDGSGDRMRKDNPVSFDFRDRQYRHRMEKDLYVNV